MDSRLLWFALGAGAVLILVKGGDSVGLGGSVKLGGFELGGSLNASVPPDQQWQVPADRERIGVWDPMGTAVPYRDVPDGSTGNGVNTGGGYS